MLVDLTARNYSQDIFDLGFMLLQCAIGDLSLYDTSNLLTLKNIRTVIENPAFKKSLKKDACCLLHNEGIVRNAMKFTPGINLPSNKSKSSSDSLSTKANSKSSSLNDAHYQMSLMEILNFGNRFSKGFLDFLCNCLRFDHVHRLDTQILLSHEFLSDGYQCHGPKITVHDLMRIENKSEESVNHKDIDGIARKHLEKFIEALKTVLLDKNMKTKFESIVQLNLKTETTQKRIMELAYELGLPTQKVHDKLIECLDAESE